MEDKLIHLYKKEFKGHPNLFLLFIPAIVFMLSLLISWRAFHYKDIKISQTQTSTNILGETDNK